MTVSIDSYPSKSLAGMKEKPVAMAKFKEPVFKLGKFQDQHIEVDVEVYPVTYQNVNGKKMVGIRFGQMSVIRFVDTDLVYHVEPLIASEE